jgi:hypothetical protein
VLSRIGITGLIPHAQQTSQSFAREPPEYSVKNMQAKVYLDEICLQDGQKWQDGFIRGLSVSLVVVPILSWSRDDNGSVGKLCRMTEENDHIDNVLVRNNAPRHHGITKPNT